MAIAASGTWRFDWPFISTEQFSVICRISVLPMDWNKTQEARTKKIIQVFLHGVWLRPRHQYGALMITFLYILSSGVFRGGKLHHFASLKKKTKNDILLFLVMQCGTKLCSHAEGQQQGRECVWHKYIWNECARGELEEHCEDSHEYIKMNCHYSSSVALMSKSRGCKVSSLSLKGRHSILSLCCPIVLQVFIDFKVFFLFAPQQAVLLHSGILPLRKQKSLLAIRMMWNGCFSLSSTRPCSPIWSLWHCLVYC